MHRRALAARLRPRARPFGAAAGLAAALVALVGFAGRASAHGGLDSRFDAPVPLWLVLAGAALAVAGTAVVLAVGDVTVGSGRGRLGTVPSGVARALRGAGRWGFLALFVASVAAGLFGPQTPATNLATVFVWPLWFKGVAVLAVLVGTPWRVLSPWRTAYDLLARLEGGEFSLATYPERLGSWPALVGFLVLFGVVENLTTVPRSPRLTVAVLAVYAFVTLAGSVAYGPTWFERGDTFAVLYRLLGRVAPVVPERRTDGGYDLSLRAPWTGCERPLGDLPLAAFVLAAVFTVSFDGLVETPEYVALAVAAGRATGLGALVDLPLYLLGAAAFVALFWAVARLTAPGDRATLVRRLAPTVLPIAAAYELAHNLDYVLLNAGQFISVLGRYVGITVAVDPLAWLPVPAFWGLQVVLVVAGHVVAVVAAHAVVRSVVGNDAARTTGTRGRPALGDGGRTLHAHLPLALAMVGYTVLSLWVVSRPVVA